MLYLDGRDTDLGVEPELLRELKENLSEYCLWVAIVIVTMSLFDIRGPIYYHRHAVDCLNLPLWQGWIELNIVIL